MTDSRTTSPLTPEHLAQCRSEFEHTALNNEWGNLSIERRKDGKYCSSHTAMAWTFFEAAWSAAPTKQGHVAEMLAGVEKMTAHEFTGGDGWWQGWKEVAQAYRKMGGEGTLPAWHQPTSPTQPSSGGGE
jgi:hypothetical protein